jgi:alpha-galactosidase
MLAYNVPRVGGKLPAPMLSGATCYFFDFAKNSEQNQAFFINGSAEKGIPLDCWWIDAGWYPCDGDWHNTGSWRPDPVRFPKGMKPISDLAHSKNMRFLLWFEPERVRPGTWLTENHPEWIFGGAKGGLLDLGNPEAWNWVTNHIDKFVTEQGVDILRRAS